MPEYHIRATRKPASYTDTSRTGHPNSQVPTRLCRRCGIDITKNTTRRPAYIYCGDCAYVLRVCCDGNPKTTSRTR